MKGDFTRNTFKPKKHYNGVRMQQGRVQVDADFNEYVDIQSHLRHTSLGDVIGFCGGPQNNAGFKIEVGKDGLLYIGKGRYYVDGILCENEGQVLLTSQPDLPAKTSLAPTAGYYLAYLDVWSRHITALEDNDIREVALGGADTMTRTKMVWQVKMISTSGEVRSNMLCSDAIFKTSWDATIQPSTCQLTASVDTSEEDPNKPCIVPARAGYRGLENQLYRVEIHDATSGKETFKWSRENGSVVFPITYDKTLDDKSYVKLSKLAKDKVLSLKNNDWVEVLGDTTELNGLPGTMAQVLPESSISKGIIVLSCDVSSHSIEKNLKIRRWDQKETDKVSLKNGVIKVKEGDSYPLENGVTVKFERISGAIYHTGDYWLIPARTATRDIDWPCDTSTTPVPQPQYPLGICHHFCRLAVLAYKASTWSVVHDCRRLFPPLTEMVRLHYVVGDGQEAMPGNPLPKPLQVSVVNGQDRVAGAKIQFKVVDGTGRVKEYKNETETPCSSFTSGGLNTVLVQTDTDGIASACWRLDSNNLSQQVEATLLEIDGKPMYETVGGKQIPFLPPVRFNASLSVAKEVYYDSSICTDTNHPQVDNVQDALDLLYCNAALFYVSGDGQEALPGQNLSNSLQVRVANGKWPVANARVVFKIESPGQGVLKSGRNQGATLEVVTDRNGLAACQWQLDATNDSQQVKAYLKRSESLPIYFNAALIRVSTSCCITIGENGDYATLTEAILDLIKKGKKTDVCFCFLPEGKPQVLSGRQLNTILSDSTLSISITGNGINNPIQIKDPIQCSGIKSFSIKDSSIEIKYVITGEKPGLVFSGCGSVSFESCKISGVTDVVGGGALLTIGTTDRVILKDNTFNASSKEKSDAVDTVVRETGDESLTILTVASTMGLTLAETDVAKNVALSANNLISMNKANRVALGENVLNLASLASNKGNMSRKEYTKVNELGLTLTDATVDYSTVLNLLNDIQEAAAKYNPGVAIVLGQVEKSLVEKPEKPSVILGTDYLNLDGVSTNLTKGDAILIVSESRVTDPSSTKWHFRQVESVTTYPEANYTRVTWKDALGTDKSAISVADNPKFYALRQSANLFGYNAPNWKKLLIEAKRSYVVGGDRLNEWPKFQIQTVNNRIIDLDKKYSNIKANTWVTLVGPSNTELYKVSNTTTKDRVEFTLTGNVTRLELDSKKDLEKFGLRDTNVYGQSEELAPIRRPESTTEDVAENDIAEDEMILLENNQITGVISLYGNSPILDETEYDKYIKSLAERDKKKSASAGTGTGSTASPGHLTNATVIVATPWTLTGRLGTLELRGNHLVGITTGKDMLAKIKELVSTGNQTLQLDVFARCILTANVIEGWSFPVTQHLSMATNDFAMGAVTVPTSGLIQAGSSITDSSVYIGNQGCRPGINWKDITFSPAVARDTNPWMQFNA